MTRRQAMGLYLLLSTVEYTGLRIVVVGVIDSWRRTAVFPVIFDRDGHTPWDNRPR